MIGLRDLRSVADGVIQFKVGETKKTPTVAHPVQRGQPAQIPSADKTEKVIAASMAMATAAMIRSGSVVIF
ncbi:hypothetical protein D1823_21735 (plasmid) [Ruegeria sp. AD91A]|uniref:hypothetical protein n=1 Tax=Ruegeria sp. AD91A TaxID=2293862 RepID=UPI000E47D2FB|nr:hypothetical protein [Ruegeria sp. AD91A]AXT29293.1 hypothetical protein D1823_21735 [Ruegeria sp. AD91A]